MVLNLKVRKSRSLPDLPRTFSPPHDDRFAKHALRSDKTAASNGGRFCLWSCPPQAMAAAASLPRRLFNLCGHPPDFYVTLREIKPRGFARAHPSPRGRNPNPWKEATHDLLSV